MRRMPEPHVKEIGDLPEGKGMTYSNRRRRFVMLEGNECFFFILCFYYVMVKTSAIGRKGGY